MFADEGGYPEAWRVVLKLRVCMFVCMYVYIYIYNLLKHKGSYPQSRKTHTQTTRGYIYIYIYIYICTHTHTHIYIHMYTHTDRVTLKRSRIFCEFGNKMTMFVMMLHIHICIYTCIYIHTHTRTYRQAYVKKIQNFLRILEQNDDVCHDTQDCH